MNTNELLTVTEAAQLLRLRVATIRAWTLKRKIPFVKLGARAVRFKRGDIEAVIQAGTIPATQEE